jgi:hypothetical protein
MVDQLGYHAIHIVHARRVVLARDFTGCADPIVRRLRIRINHIEKSYDIIEHLYLCINIFCTNN